MAGGMPDINWEASRFMERVEINLLDMKSEPSNGFSFIGHAEDQYTNFCVLFPLKDDSPKEIAQCLKKYLISYFGPPVSFVSNFEQSFLSEVLCEVLGCWKAGRLSFMISDKRKTDSRGQKSVLVANFVRDNISKMAAESCSEYSSWSDWLPEIMLRLNVCKHTSRHQTPYTALFKQKTSEPLLAEPQDLRPRCHASDTGVEVTPEVPKEDPETKENLSRLYDDLNEQGGHSQQKEDAFQNTSDRDGTHGVTKASSESENATTATSVIDNTAAAAALQELVRVKQELYDPAYDLSSISSSTLLSEQTDITNLPTQTPDEDNGNMCSSFVRFKENESINEYEDNTSLSEERRYVPNGTNEHPGFSKTTDESSQSQPSCDDLKSMDAMDKSFRVKLEPSDVPPIEQNSSSTYRVNTNDYSVINTTLPGDSVYTADGCCVQLVEANLSSSYSVTRNDYPINNTHRDTVSTADGCSVSDGDRTSEPHVSNNSCTSSVHGNVQNVSQTGQEFYGQSNNVSAAELADLEVTSKSAISAAETVSSQSKLCVGITEKQIVSDEGDGGETMDENTYVQPSIEIDYAEDGDNDPGLNEAVPDTDGNGSTSHLQSYEIKDKITDNLKVEQPAINMSQIIVCEKVSVDPPCISIVNFQEQTEKHKAEQPAMIVSGRNVCETVTTPEPKERQDLPVFSSILPTEPDSDLAENTARTMFLPADINYLKSLLYITPMLKVDEIRKRLENERRLAVSSQDLIKKIAALTHLIQKSESDSKEKKPKHLAASEVTSSELGMLVERNLKSKRRSYLVKVNVNTGDRIIPDFEPISQEDTMLTRLAGYHQGERVEKSVTSSSLWEKTRSEEGSNNGNLPRLKLSETKSLPNPTKRSCEETIVIDLTESPSPQEEIVSPFKRPCKPGPRFTK